MLFSGALGKMIPIPWQLHNICVINPSAGTIKAVSDETVTFPVLPPPHPSAPCIW
jgi:hypothetical protein